MVVIDSDSTEDLQNSLEEWFANDEGLYNLTCEQHRKALRRLDDGADPDEALDTDRWFKRATEEAAAYLREIAVTCFTMDERHLAGVDFWALARSVDS